MTANDTLDKKLRKIFRKELCKNFILGFRGDTYQLADKLPLRAYSELERDLSPSEFCELKTAFDVLGIFGEKEQIFSVIPVAVWLDRCCSDLELLHIMTTHQLEKILSYSNIMNTHISKLFFVQSQTDNYQCLIINLLPSDRLDHWMAHFTQEEHLKFNEFLFQMYQKEKNTEYEPEKEKIATIFEKIASISNKSLANLLANMSDTLIIKRLLKEFHKMNRDPFDIYRKIQDEDKLFNLLARSEFSLLDDITASVYSWWYSAIFNSKYAQIFLEYLWQEKRNELVLFDKNICIGIYNLVLCNNLEKIAFMYEIVEKQGIERFEEFYEAGALEEKEDILKHLVQTEKGIVILELLFAEKENLSLLETLIKEKYVVTRK